MGLEEPVESGLVREMEFVDDFLDAYVSVLQQVLCFEDYIGVDPVRSQGFHRKTVPGRPCH